VDTIPAPRARLSTPSRPDCQTAFGGGLLKDRAAVAAAITNIWSNGQTEGQITRLKLIKRQMYGRAKLDLLEARLVRAK